MRASHALGGAPLQRFETANKSASMLSISQSLAKVAMISPWVTRRGPSVPGVCSEKHSRWSSAPGSVTRARLFEYSGRTAFANV